MERPDIYSRWRSNAAPVESTLKSELLKREFVQQMIDRAFSDTCEKQIVPYFFVTRLEEAIDDFAGYTIATEDQHIATIKVEHISSLNKAQQREITFVHTLFCVFNDDTTLFIQQEAFKEFARMIKKTRQLPLYSDRYRLTQKGVQMWEHLCQEGVAEQTGVYTLKGEPVYRFIG